MPQNRADFTLEPADQETLARLSGPLDSHLRLIESRLGVHVHNRGARFNVTGPDEAVRAEEGTRVYDNVFSEHSEDGEDRARGD